MPQPGEPAAAETTANPLVLIGSSAAGTDALVDLLTHLQPNFPAPVMIALRLDPRDTVNLAELLRASVTLPVTVVTEEQRLQPGTIYIGPAGRNIEISGDHHAGVVQAAPATMSTIDGVMSAAARFYADQLIAVMLAGAGADGAAGALAVKAYGGSVVVQNADTTLAEIPQSAIDIVADLSAIPPLLADLLTGDYASSSVGEGDELRLFLDRVREKAGIDFGAYKRPTIERRLQRRMAASGATTLNAYWRYIDRHPEELHQLVSTFLIKVTDFFRDPELFRHLRAEVLPALIARARERGTELRIWSAGCATGEEAYSIAILVADLLGEEAVRLPVRIFATDIAADAVDFARRGLYPASALADVPDEICDRHFARVDGVYEISRGVRSLVVFGEHDLANRAPFPRIDLVMCRNVLIYFTSELQRRVLQRFAFSLRPNGLLVLGKAESVSPLPSYFALEEPRLKIFRRNDAVAPIMTDYSHVIGPGVTGGAGTTRRVPARRLTAHTSSSIGHTSGERAVMLLDRLSIGVVIVDRAYDIRTINVAARRLLDIRGAGVGDDLIHQVTPDLGAPLKSAIDAAFNGEANAIEVHSPPNFSNESGLYLTVSCAPVPVDEASATALLAQIEISDITAYVQRQRSLEVERNQLVAERDQLQWRANDAGITVQNLRNANDDLATELGRLQAENEQLQLANEEVQAAAEEIETLNEEQQAANEELETLNEELQATIEELNTANSELESRTIQLESMASMLEARRHETEEWFRAVVEEATDYGIFTTDRGNRIDSWPPGAEAVFGWSPVEAIGQPADIIFTPEDRASGVPGQELEAARESGSAEDTRWHIRKDGSRVFIEGSVHARHAPDGSFDGLLKIGQDATERHLAEQARLDQEEQARVALERQIASATAELRALSRRVLEVQEEERRHLALELHDEIGQVLTGLSLQLAPDTPGPEVLAEARQTVARLTEQVRQLSMDLRPATLDNFGLAVALNWLLERYQRQTGIEVELRQSGLERRFPPDIEITAFRIVQEALTNVARHSGADRAVVHLLAEDEELTLRISDRGRGFEIGALRPGGGLLGMRERVELIDGTLSVESAPGSGVTITAELPTTRSEPDTGTTANV